MRLIRSQASEEWAAIVHATLDPRLQEWSAVDSAGQTEDELDKEIDELYDDATEEEAECFYAECRMMLGTCMFHGVGVIRSHQCVVLLVRQGVLSNAVKLLGTPDTCLCDFAEHVRTYGYQLVLLGSELASINGGPIQAVPIQFPSPEFAS